MIGMTGIAAIFGTMAVMPYVAILLLVFVTSYAATGVLTTGVLFGRGDQRAFCIGALVVVLSSWTPTGGGFLGEVVNTFDWLLGGFGMALATYLEAGLKYVVLAILAMINGWLCIRARRYFERHSSE